MNPSRIVAILVFCVAVGTAMGQQTGSVHKTKVPKSNWELSWAFRGNDTYQDNGAFPAGMRSVAWDSARGSLAMNGCDWLRSAAWGSTPQLCLVSSMGKAIGTLLWKGAGPAPAEVTVTVTSNLIARYADPGSPPSLALLNGLGSKTATCRRDGLIESAASGDATFRLPVSKGAASFSVSLSGQVTTIMGGFAALRSELSAKIGG